MKKGKKSMLKFARIPFILLVSVESEKTCCACCFSSFPFMTMRGCGHASSRRFPANAHICTRTLQVFTQLSIRAWRRWRYDANDLLLIRRLPDIETVVFNTKNNEPPLFNFVYQFCKRTRLIAVELSLSL